jgi:hypothetical protein
MHCSTMIQDSEYRRDDIVHFHVLVVLLQLCSKSIPNVSGVVSYLTCIIMMSSGLNLGAGTQR